MTYQWFNELRLGDCFWHCLFMRRLAKRQPEDSFILYCNPAHWNQLNEVVKDLPNIALKDAGKRPSEARNCWIGEKWYSHPLCHDIVAFLVDWFRFLAEEAKLEPVFNLRGDLLADYPALQATKTRDANHWLIVNSYPQSGQWGFNLEDMRRFITQLRQRYEVSVTDPRFGSITDVGKISQGCGMIIGCATGPMWPTFNIWNGPDVRRIMWMAETKLDYGWAIPHHRTIAETETYLRQNGLL